MDIRKLQRVIVDGLEDVKAQNIVVFNTEHLSPLFERVIVASGTSNRQTKSLAASVRDAVKAAGDPPPRTEGEDNGEWIIVDCGAAVVHVMQPAIRDYYHLEELWGDKPVQDEDRLGRAAPGEGGGAPGRARRRWREARGARHGSPRRRGRAAGIGTGQAAGSDPASAGVGAQRRRSAATARRAGAGQAGGDPHHRRQEHGREGGPQRTSTGGEEGGGQALSLRGSRRRTVKLVLVAVGQRPPAWAQTAFDDYAKRFPPELKFELKAVKAEPRDSRTPEQLMAAEARRIEAALPRGVRRIALDERGQRVTTAQLAERLLAWQRDGRDAALLIGGPDGLDPALKASCDESLRLSDLTLAACLRPRARRRGALPRLVGDRRPSVSPR